MVPPSMTAPTALVPSLPCHDLAATRDFYVRDLGLAVALEGPARLRIRVGAAALEFRQQEVLVPRDDGLRLVFACPDPPALLRRLRALGVEVDVPPPGSGPVARDGEVRFLARDPDGRLVAFSGPRTRGGQ